MNLIKVYDTKIQRMDCLYVYFTSFCNNSQPTQWYPYTEYREFESCQNENEYLEEHTLESTGRNLSYAVEKAESFLSGGIVDKMLFSLHLSCQSMSSFTHT